MKTAKLQAFEPIKNSSGNHKTVETKYGTMWKFKTTFDGGDTGETLSSRQQPTWQPGSEYDYEIEVNGKYTNIKILGKKNATGTVSYAKNKKTKEQWLFYCSQRIIKALVAENETNFSPLQPIELEENVNSITQVMEQVVAKGMASSKLLKKVGESEIWFLTLNTVESLIKNGSNITIENVRAFNNICVKYLL